MGNKPQTNIKVKVVSNKRRQRSDCINQNQRIHQNALNHISNMSIENITQLQAYNSRRGASENEAIQQPRDSELCKTIKSDINLHKGSIKLVKCESQSYKYNLAFEFDALYE